MASKRGRLEGKVAVVTAAAQGIGRATAVRFAEEGCKVIAVDINHQRLRELDGTDGIITRKLDVLDKDAIEKLARDFADVDILFNCVGYCHQGSVFDCDEKTFDLSYNVNVKSMFLMTKAFAPQMVSRKRGSIVNVSSVASSVKGLANRFAYGTTKAAVIGMTKSLAVDLVKDGVRVNCVCPGTVETPSWWERVREHPDPEAAKRDFVARQKMGRLGTAEEIAGMVLYLASDEASYVTGSEFLIDGGVAL